MSLLPSIMLLVCTVSITLSTSLTFLVQSHLINSSYALGVWQIVFVPFVSKCVLCLYLKVRNFHGMEFSKLKYRQKYFFSSTEKLKIHSPAPKLFKWNFICNYQRNQSSFSTELHSHCYLFIQKYIVVYYFLYCFFCIEAKLNE